MIRIILKALEVVALYLLRELTGLVDRSWYRRYHDLAVVR